MKKILVIDNYDSFTYNLVHYLEDLDCEVTVYRNDEFDIDEIKKFNRLSSKSGRFHFHKDHEAYHKRSQHRSAAGNTGKGF